MYSIWNVIVYSLNNHLINTLKKSLVIVHLNLCLSPLGWHDSCNARYYELLNSIKNSKLYFRIVEKEYSEYARMMPKLIPDGIVPKNVRI